MWTQLASGVLEGGGSIGLGGPSETSSAATAGGNRISTGGVHFGITGGSQGGQWLILAAAAVGGYLLARVL